MKIREDEQPGEGDVENKNMKKYIHIYPIRHIPLIRYSNDPKP
jgi:hypothetical protein